MKFAATAATLLLVLLVGTSLEEPSKDMMSTFDPPDPQALDSHGPYLEDGVEVLRAAVRALNGTTFDCGHELQATPTLDAGPDRMLLYELDTVLWVCTAHLVGPVGPDAGRNTLVARAAIEQGKVEEVARAYIADAVLAIQAATAALNGVEPGSVAEVEAQAFLMRRLGGANSTLNVGLRGFETGDFDNVRRVKTMYSNMEFALMDANAIRHIVATIPWSDGTCQPPPDLYERTRQQLDAAIEAGLARDPRAEDAGALVEILQSALPALVVYEERDWWPAVLTLQYEAQVSEAGWRVPPFSHPNEIPWGLAVRMMDSVLENNRTLYLEHLYTGVLAVIEDAGWQGEVRSWFAPQLVGAATTSPFLGVVCS